MKQVFVMLVCAVLGCAACSKHTSAPPTGPGSPQPGPGQDTTEPRAGTGAGPASPGPGSETPADTPRPVSAAECETLLDHFLEIAFAAHAREVAPEVVPTAEQVAEIRADMAPAFLAACRELDRATYECEMKAQTREALLACSAEDTGRGAGAS